MRAYSALDEEAVQARNLLKDWAGESFITEAQHRLMEEETVCGLRRTNVFLRVVLFLFTLIIVGAAVALFFVVFLSPQNLVADGVFFLICAALTYAAAELAVFRARLYRYGIEEALAACSVAFLCVGMQAGMFDRSLSSPAPEALQFLVPAAGAVFSLWIWHRFGFLYAPLAAMIFALWLPDHWTSSHSAQHLVVAAFYAAGLFAVAVLRRPYRFTYLYNRYSIAEALLWLGIYVAMNLQLSSIDLLRRWWLEPQTGADFSKPFYWATWVLIWCLPPIVLARGLRRKDRLVVAAGSLAAILTLITNKAYLGWQRHTRDLMLLGVLLMGVALFIRRWLARGPGGIRHGFTAQRLSGKDKAWMSAGTTALGVVSPGRLTPSAQADTSGVQFGGGDSGGAGATSDF